jgi:hypothetical protein
VSARDDRSASATGSGDRPLVTVGIPAYNRPQMLARAIRSALAQDHGAVDVLVSDDASTDPAVQRVARDLARDDERLRYVRQVCNLGHAANYQWLLESARGNYFMWLADDDWIDRDYVSRCLAALLDTPANRLVCGLGRYYRDGEYILDERRTDLTSSRPGCRVIRYFSRVSLNGPLFGLARRPDLLSIGFPEVVGGDWLLVAAIAAQGAVRTLPEVRIHRSLDGLSADPGSLARSFGKRGLAARSHHAFFAAGLWRGLTARRGSLASMRPSARISVATLSAASILARFTLVDLVRSAVGPGWAAALERRVSTWLRARDGG